MTAEMAGQMTVGECIEVAAGGLDGRPATGPTGARLEGASAGGGGELVLQGERSASRRLEPCKKGPPRLRWQLPSGELLPVRCGRSNSCPACAWLASVENVSVVAIDAREGDRPTVGMTLTTRSADFDMARYRRAVSEIFRWLRREFGSELAYLLVMEWSTGSGGHGRLPHGHLLVKRLPSDVDLSPGCALWRELKHRWELQTGAWRVELRELKTPAGAIAYMVGHHHKSEQAPPAGWSGKRFRPSRNYFDEPVRSLRERVRHDRAVQKRTQWLLGELAERGVDPDQLDDEMWAQQSKPGPAPRLVQVQSVPSSFGVDGLPAAWTVEVVGVVTS
jgi:hypothetical protein